MNMEERRGSAIQQNKRCLVRNRSIGNRGRDAKPKIFNTDQGLKSAG